MSFQVAKREALPLLAAISGFSGTGKTYSALLMAAGLAGDNGKVGFIDTEAGRGSMYADDEEIISALPEGCYRIKRLVEPFTPASYMNAIKEAVRAGISVLVIDSASHEWEGFGGCQDIAENNKLRGMPNWAKAKGEHKKLMNLITQTPMHIIFCLRAREKSVPMRDENGKTTVVNMGVQPIQEKNFMYEMTVSMLLDDVVPGKPIITKCPKPLRHLFAGEQAVITKDIGRKMKAWADGGLRVDMVLRSFKRDCRAAAMEGSVVLDQFFKDMPVADKTVFSDLTDQEFQIEMRTLADTADMAIADSEGAPSNNDDERPNFDNDK